jgi:hypothetical protein
MNVAVLAMAVVEALELGSAQVQAVGVARRRLARLRFAL